MNQVDCSPETVNAEWDRIAAELGAAGQAGAKGAPVGPAQVPPSGASDVVERLRGTLLVAFKLGFGWLVPAWRVTDEECARLAEVWAKVGAKYLPASWLRWLPGTARGGASECPECDALVVTVQIVGPRLKSQVGEPEPVQGKDSEKPKWKQEGKNGKGPQQFAYAADFPDA
ncbi:MAG: hypothetical protein D6721_09435 [Gammaproteobacteria bacterium]|nr:MAG: hypothetical protein D6721_09435 [Gammaproteobacteria bacterium]